jgi:hypothetical protein
VPFEAPNGWAIEIVDQGSAGRLTTFEWHAWPSMASHLANDVPFVLMNHKAQFRTEHQRIVRGGSGGLLWRGSGSTVEILDMNAFADADIAIKYLSGDSEKLTEWEAVGGEKTAPFQFPAFDGRMQALDPQWVRELHTVSLDDLIMDAILKSVSEIDTSGRRGDLRGTTLNLQVGSSGDDGWWSDVAGTGTTYGGGWSVIYFGDANAAARDQMSMWNRFTGISGISNATITSATTSLWGNDVDLNTPNGKIRATDSETPAAPTNLTEAQALESTTTTAGVDWDSPGLSVSAFTASPSIVPVIQELVNSYDPGEIQIIIRNDASSNLDECRADPYEADTSHAAKLDIDYSGPYGLYGGMQRWA